MKSCTSLLEGTFGHGVVPGDVLPLAGAGAAHHRARDAVGVLDDLARFGVNDVAQLEHRGALRAQAAFVDGMLGVALKVDQLAVARRAQAAATAGAVTADVRGLFGLFELPFLFRLFGEGGSGCGKLERQRGGQRSSRCLEESST